MVVVKTPGEVRAWRARLSGVEGGVGFVPTMGYLHAGHRSLVDRARAECAHVAASIFVNPAQFNVPGDLAAYPRDLPRDLSLLEAAGCDLAFVPTVATMYPDGFQTWVDVGAVADPLEGAHRPGHFRGVATVVLKLFNIVGPTRAYFGLKDYQQLAVVRAMVRDLDLAVDVVGCETVREPDGLALSSRNARLAPADRPDAPVLHRALAAARDLWRAGERDAEALRALMRDVLATAPRVRVEYVSAADAASLAELDRVDGATVLSLAAHLGDVRLIDNVVLVPGGDGAASDGSGRATTGADRRAGLDPNGDQLTRGH